MPTKQIIGEKLEFAKTAYIDRMASLRTLILVLLVVLLPADTQAQAPTPESALRGLKNLTSTSDNPRPTIEAAESVLRQVYHSYSEAELDAFARELEQLILDEVEPQASNAARALAYASDPEGSGTPYTKATDVFIRIYERYRANPSMHDKAYSALLDVKYANGMDYVIDLYRSTEQPEKPCFDTVLTRQPDVVVPPEDEWCMNVREKSEWCRAADVLRWDREGWQIIAPDNREYVKYCGLRRLNPSYDDPDQEP